MNPPLTDALAGDLSALADKLRRATPVVRPTRALSRRTTPGEGAGLIWAADGTVVTNAHVATGDAASVTLFSGRTVRARVAARDARRDLALLQLEADLEGELLAAAPTIGSPARLRAGELVVALGHPLGVQHAVTMGVVHATPPGRRSPYVVADIRLAPGNSGGPLADAHGQIVGVNTMIAAGLGVAISTDVVSGFVAAAMPRPSIGVHLRPVSVRATSGERLESPALLVLDADPLGAAARAGVAQGDVILGHDGQPFGSESELATLINTAGSGGILHLDIGRGGRRMTAVIRLPTASTPSRRAA